MGIVHGNFTVSIAINIGNIIKSINSLFAFMVILNTISYTDPNSIPPVRNP